MSQTKIVPIKLNDGTIMNIEATRVGNEEEEIAEIDRFFQFSDATTQITSISREIVDSAKKIDLDKICVKMGFEIGIESGKLIALLAKGTAKANLEITLEWSKK